MRIRADHNPVTVDDLKVMFDLFAGIDGHPRDKTDFDTWTIAARAGRWSRAQVAAASLALTTGFRGFRIMPGHIAEQINLDRERIRNRWYCPDPPRELGDDPAAEIRWRRQVAADYAERALLALAAGRDLDSVPIEINPEPDRPAVAYRRDQLAEVCARIGARKAIDAAPSDAG